MNITWDEIREIGLAMPEVEESMSYGTSALKVRGKLLARLHEKEGVLVVRTDLAERDHLLKVQPDTYFITAHYKNDPWVLVRLDKIKYGELKDLLALAKFLRVGE